MPGSWLGGNGSLRCRRREAGRGPAVLPGFPPAARRRVERILQAGAIELHLGSAVTAIESGGLRRADGAMIACDAVILATGVAALPWLRDSGLATDASGFVAVDACLQSLSHPGVFAAGDMAAMAGHALAKAGVFAVRQGPVLAENLFRICRGQPLRRYRPQSAALALIATGARHAVAARGSFAAEGGWLWWLKDGIDRRFMRRYRL